MSLLTYEDARPWARSIKTRVTKREMPPWNLDPTVGIIHKLRRSRPSLACDLIEPLRCTVELTVVRHLDDLQEPKRLALMTGGHFDPYLDQFSLAEGAATEWFCEHLGDPLRRSSIVRRS